MSIQKTMVYINSKGFSDAFVGEKIGVSSNSVFNYRHGKADPSSKIAEKIFQLEVLVRDFSHKCDLINKEK